jgi:hypothetical protein
MGIVTAFNAMTAGGKRGRAWPASPAVSPKRSSPRRSACWSPFRRCGSTTTSPPRSRT